MINTAGLFLLLGAEFLAMVLVVVYVGAVAVLFLFVVMMLDIDLARMREGFLAYLPTGLLVGALLLVELGMVFAGWVVAPHAGMMAQAPSPITGGGISNTEALGRILYTHYAYLFQASGLILLVAMVGTIVLTMRHRDGVRKQKVADQIARTAANSMEMRKVPTGGGI